MNKKVALYLAGALTLSLTTTSCSNINDIISLRPRNNFYNTDGSEITKEQIEETLSSIPPITYDTIVNESEVTTSESTIAETTQNNNDQDLPIEERITITNNSNTRNDVFTNGQICINNSDFVLPKDISSSIYTAINDLKNSGIDAGFYLTDIDTNMTISYNGNKNFQPASTVKAGMALYAVKQIENGKYNFEDLMTYESKHYCEGSGNIQNYNVGTQFSLKDIIHETINVSDNIGYYMLLDKFGYEGYNEMISDLGCKTWLNDYTKWGYLTPQELNLIWQEIYAYSKQSPEGEWLFNEFLNAEFNFIKECLPEYNSAHKSGFNRHGYHDSAVVFGDRTYVLTIMTTQSWWNTSNLDKLAEPLDDAVQAYNKYLETINKLDSQSKDNLEFAECEK